MGRATAYIDCRCGECRVTLGDPVMRYRMYCLCYDCRQRLLIAASERPEYPLSTAVANDDRGADSMFFTGALLIDDTARRLLTFTKLRDTSETVTAWACCCDTPLASDHPFYEGNAILAHADVSNVTTTCPMEPQYYDFASDFPADKVSALPVLPLPIVFNFVSNPEEIEGESMAAFVKAMRVPKAPQYTEAPYQTFEQLREGQPITIRNGCYEESRRRA